MVQAINLLIINKTILQNILHTMYTHQRKDVQDIQTSVATSLLDSSSQSERLQRKADMTNNAAQRAETLRPNNTGMPDNLKSGIESLSGFSMDDVRVHYNSSKPATVQALAYTQGTDIHVASGQEKHLPHEAWHVAQQMAGRVSPTTNINGMPVNDNASLEHEADVMGEKAVQMKSDESMTVQRATIWNGVTQRVKLEDYYYHISDGKIKKNINPKRVLEVGRTRGGDDLGPGFYMGDSNFLPYYYKKYFITKDVCIYYIEKNLIESKNPTDFTNTFETTEKKDLFQIAMELGFADKSGNIALDLLPQEKMDTFQELVREKYKKDADRIFNFFENANKNAIWKGYINDTDRQQFQITLTKEDIENFFLISNHYFLSEPKPKERVCAKLLASVLPKYDPKSPDKFCKESEQKIIDILSTFNLHTFNKQAYHSFFDLAKEKQENLTEKDIEDFFLNFKARFSAKLLASKLPKNLKKDSFLQLCKDSKTIIKTTYNELKIDSRVTEKILQDYEDFLEQKKRYTYNCLELDGNRPIQIAIRPNVEDVKPVVSEEGAKPAESEEDAKPAESVKKITLLEIIKKNEIPITDEDIESTRTELKTAGTKSGTEGDAENEGPKPEPIKPAETEPATKGDAINEGSKLELLKAAGTESATSKDLKSESKPARTKPEASDDLKNQLKTVLAVAKEEKLAEDSSSGNK